jgi:hypothetical protein
MSTNCTCPHVATAYGLTRSGWSADCPFHGVSAAQPVPLQFETTTTGDTRELCEHCKGSGRKQPTAK